MWGPASGEYKSGLIDDLRRGYRNNNRQRSGLVGRLDGVGPTVARIGCDIAFRSSARDESVTDDRMRQDAHEV